MEIPEGWGNVEGKLIRNFEFRDFTEAMLFINRVGVVAEQLDHHPEIHNIYNKVTLTLSTHDAGNIITEKDIKLAQEISNL